MAAPLARYREDFANTATLPISGFHGIPYLVISEELWGITRNRFAREMSAWIAGDPVAVIVQTDPPKTSGGSLQAEVIDLALM